MWLASEQGSEFALSLNIRQYLLYSLPSEINTQVDGYKTHQATLKESPDGTFRVPVKTVALVMEDSAARVAAKVIIENCMSRCLSLVFSRLSSV